MSRKDSWAERGVEAKFRGTEYGCQYAEAFVLSLANC
jgi:hypothetical protein